MTRTARLAISAIALAAGVAVFWVSISMWTRDRIYARDGLASACLRDGDIDRFMREPQRFRSYLANIVAIDAGVIKHPPGPSGLLARVLIERFGFLYVPQEDHIHLMETMRPCPPIRI